jgi:hypothetical protein
VCVRAIEKERAGILVRVSVLHVFILKADPALVARVTRETRALLAVAWLIEQSLQDPLITRFEAAIVFAKNL